MNMKSSLSPPAFPYPTDAALFVCNPPPSVAGHPCLPGIPELEGFFGYFMRIWSVHPLYLYHQYGAFHIYVLGSVGAIPQRRQLLSSMVPILCCQYRSSGWCPLRIRLMHVYCSLDSMLYRNFKATAIPSSVSFKNDLLLNC